MTVDYDPGTVSQLRRIKQFKLDSAERTLNREMSALRKIDDDIKACELEKEALAHRRLTIMSDLERSDLTLNDLCTYHARMTRSDQQIEREDAVREELEGQRFEQEAVVSDIRQTIVRLQHRLDQWEALIPADAGAFEVEEN